MKKACSVLLAAILLASLLSGCAEKPAAVSETDGAAVSEPANEIVTYKKLDPEKTTLVVSRTGNIYIDNFSKEFERLNPDIQVVCLDITGGNKTVTPASDWIVNGLAPDVMF